MWKTVRYLCLKPGQYVRSSQGDTTTGHLNTNKVDHRHGRTQTRSLCRPLRGRSGKDVRLEIGRPGFDSRLRLRSFSRSSHASDLKIGSPEATLPGAWRYRVSAGIGWLGVSILGLGEIESCTATHISYTCVSGSVPKIHQRVARALSSQQTASTSLCRQIRHGSRPSQQQQRERQGRVQ